MANKIAYFVDIVLVIDSTGSMRPVINRVKLQALEFHGKILARMEEKKKTIDRLRMRVVAFRDFWADSEPIREMPEFIDMESAPEKFDAFVNELWADGGGDEPERGLEALALAIQSPWYKNARSIQETQYHRRLDRCECASFGESAGVAAKKLPGSHAGQSR